MTSRDFCYWLQGLFELGAPKMLDAEQTASVKAHLAMVFVHEIDPSMGPPAHQDELNKLHQEIDKVKADVEKAAQVAHDAISFGPGPKIRC